MLATPPEQAGARVRKTDECGEAFNAFISFIYETLREDKLIDLTDKISEIIMFINIVFKLKKGH